MSQCQLRARSVAESARGGSIKNAKLRGCASTLVVPRSLRQAAGIAETSGQNVEGTQTVDIGAFELHPSIENIADKTTAEDTAFNFDSNTGDDGASLITSVVATSSNQTLVPDANLVETDGTANDGVWNLSITPASNQSGTTTITVTVTATNGRTATDTFDLSVSADNDNPTLTNNRRSAVAVTRRCRRARSQRERRCRASRSWSTSSSAWRRLAASASTWLWKRCHKELLHQVGGGVG